MPPRFSWASCRSWAFSGVLSAFSSACGEIMRWNCRWLRKSLWHLSVLVCKESARWGHKGRFKLHKLRIETWMNMFALFHVAYAGDWIHVPSCIQGEDKVLESKSRCCKHLQTLPLMHHDAPDISRYQIWPRSIFISQELCVASAESFSVLHGLHFPIFSIDCSKAACLLPSQLLVALIQRFGV